MLKFGYRRCHERPGIPVGESLVGRPGLQAVLPMGGADGRLWPWRERTQVMAVLNLTPDSFSDGGQVFAF